MNNFYDLVIELDGLYHLVYNTAFLFVLCIVKNKNVHSVMKAQRPIVVQRGWSVVSVHVHRCVINRMFRT